MERGRSRMGEEEVGRGGREGGEVGRGRRWSG